MDFLGSNYPTIKFSSRKSKISVFDTLAFFSTIKEAWQIDFGNEFSSGYVHILKQDTEVWTVFSITREKSKWSSTSENKWDLGWLRNHRRESRFFLTYSYTKFCSLNKSLFFMQFLFIFVRKYFLVEIFTLKTVRRLALPY